MQRRSKSTTESLLSTEENIDHCMHVKKLFEVEERTNQKPFKEQLSDITQG